MVFSTFLSLVFVSVWLEIYAHGIDSKNQSSRKQKIWTPELGFQEELGYKISMINNIQLLLDS
jgi:hypothetical protein